MNQVQLTTVKKFMHLQIVNESKNVKNFTLLKYIVQTTQCLHF